MAESPSTPESNATSFGSDYAEIIILRHGETLWNVDGRIQGHVDVELNEAGRQQAALRALETAETIAARCGGLQVIKDTDLRERHLGDLQGLVFSEAAKINPEAFRALLSHKTSQDIPGGGESLDQLYQRCTSCLQRIARKHIGERVIVVTHGGVISTLYENARPNNKAPRKVLNTSIHIFLIPDEKNWTIKTWGDVSHLNQTEYLESGFGGDRISG
ncbi:phosphoglycerate mutase-like protein 4 isoform X2 [Jatropha curcas]|uniref:phosphoglycerate mutase-like protein 4 isoform X2 n=1 Tax=Jatropha curcas TaxID=180498 RepID=UPI0005FAC67A|nr:phosphoglycerate mutase-like protein 4 isoform X2 [Jatropha curcas]